MVMQGKGFPRKQKNGGFSWVLFFLFSRENEFFFFLGVEERRRRGGNAHIDRQPDVEVEMEVAV